MKKENGGFKYFEKYIKDYNSLFTIKISRGLTPVRGRSRQVYKIVGNSIVIEGSLEL